MCCGVAQEIFIYAAAYNQPLNAWNVGQVTSMKVRLASEGPPSLRSPGTRPGLSVHVTWHGAEYV